MPRERPFYLVLEKARRVGGGPSPLPEILRQSGPPFKTHRVAIGCGLRALARRRDCRAVSGATGQLLVLVCFATRHNKSIDVVQDVGDERIQTLRTGGFNTAF